MMSHLRNCQDNGKNITNARKFTKKYYKKTLNLLKEYDGIVKISNLPTPHLFVGNGGMLCGVGRDELLVLFKIYGSIVDLIMIPQKSYSFLSFDSVISAEEAMATLNGYIFYPKDGQPVAPIYLFYIESPISPSYISTTHEYPVEGKHDIINGLSLIESFISEEYEKQLIEYFMAQLNDVQDSLNTMKHRSVKHFGFEFLYGVNNIDRSKPLQQKIPDICKLLLDKILQENLIDFIPDQLTVNQYHPGQGIPQHIDTHSAFEDGIISLSLNHKITMDFSNPDGKKIPIMLPQRSLLVMKGESRYLWSHGITPRCYDIFYIQDTSSDQKKYPQLNLTERGLRISLTFRKIRYKPCRCIYKEKCDSQQVKRESNTEQLYLPNTNHEAVDLEGKHVNEVYEEIAGHFSDTRHSAWPRIKEFLCQLSSGSLVADVGCGNGKYLGVNPKIMSIGCDRSSNLVNICNQRGFETNLSDCLYLPYRSNLFDASICIAVVHHLSTDARRLDSLKELVRITQRDGRILVSVWALEQNEEDIRGNDKKELEKVTHVELNERQTIEVSKGRNQFQQQDLLIPWHLKQNDDNRNISASLKKDEKVLHRFYHVFKEGELEELCSQIENVEIEKVYFDRGNWCIILRKK